MRVAVFGAGGVGGYFGGRLAEAGHEVTFVARGAHLQAIRRDGLRVESPVGGDVHVRARAADDPATVGPVEAVLVGVKAWQVPEAARAVRPLIGPDTAVVPLQNGVEAYHQLRAELGAGPVLGGLCRVIAYIAAPGVIRNPGGKASIAFGEWDGRRTDRVERLRAAFAACRGLVVQVPEDVPAAVWDKFLFIAALSGVGAVSRSPVGAIRTVPETRALLEAAMREVHALARARGIALPDDAVARAMRFVDGLPADGTASMQRDIADGKPSELDSQSGAVVRLGRESGVDTPVHAFLYASLLPLERRARGELPAA